MFNSGAVELEALGAALSSSLMPDSSSREREEPVSLPGPPRLASGNHLNSFTAYSLASISLRLMGASFRFYSPFVFV